MANLRANKITTGTADYQGSIYASGTNAYLLTTTTAPGTDDFTIECWINSDNAAGANQDGIFAINAQTVASGGFQSSATNQIRLAQGRDGTDGQNGGLEVKLNGTAVGTGDGNDIIQEGTWHHVAVTRASGTVKIWVDGVEKASGSAAGDVTGTTFLTGYYDGNYTYQGYMSNFRYRKGTAHYTTTFTPPTGPLERTSDTELLFAQSVNNAGDGYSSAIHGGTTDIMQVKGNVTANTSAPTLTTTSSVGAVFEGDAKVNSQGYMYFPTGDTSQRGRGRGLFMGGYVPSAYKSGIDAIQIQSLGNSITFGNLSHIDYAEGTSVASATRAVKGGKASGGNHIEYVTIATTGNAIDFGGDLTSARRSLTGISNGSRGVFCGGAPTIVNVMDYITIATTGVNAADFGDLTVTRRSQGSASSTTRGVVGGGNANPANSDVIDYITIASTGDATDFGNLTVGRRELGGCSSSTRGVFACGWKNPGAFSGEIDYITIASTGNATDFGDSVLARSGVQGTSNSIRGIFKGGASPTYQNAIEYVTIATTGNSVDFGDGTANAAAGIIHYGGCSDSHGGLT